MCSMESFASRKLHKANKRTVATLKNSLRHTTALGTDVFGNIQRLDNLLEAMPDRLNACEEELSNTKQQLENAKAEVDKPFPHEEELKTKTERLAELNALLDMDKKDNEIVDVNEKTAMKKNLTVPTVVTIGNRWHNKMNCMNC